GDDAVEPGKELCVPFEGRQVLMGLEKSILTDVSRLVRVMHHPERYRIGFPLVLPHQLLESTGVAFASCFDELSFVWVHPPGSVTLDLWDRARAPIIQKEGKETPE